jgi:hypothetical protein
MMQLTSATVGSEMKNESMIVALCLGAISASGAAVSAGMSSAQPKCQETRSFTAERYWFWHAYLGVTAVVDNDAVRRGRLVFKPSICFQVDRESLEDELARTHGYKEAFQEWLKRIPGDSAQWPEDNEEAMVARRPLQNIAGREFAAPRDVKQWWIENHDYLVWSGEAGHLVVDESAKRDKTPVAKQVPEVSAIEYWSFAASGALRDSFEKDGFLYMTAWIPPEGEQEFRTKKSGLADRHAKLAGFRHALAVLVLDGVAIKQIRGPALEKRMERLRDLTALPFQNREQWISWFERNKNNLELSADGTHLIVGETSKDE